MTVKLNLLGLLHLCIYALATAPFFRKPTNASFTLNTYITTYGQDGIFYTNIVLSKQTEYHIGKYGQVRL